MRAKVLQKHKNKEVKKDLPINAKNSNSLLSGIVAPKNVKDAKRILSKLIAAFIKNEIEDTRAKTLCYLLNSYVSITRETDFESRLSELEKIIEEEKK